MGRGWWVAAAVVAALWSGQAAVAQTHALPWALRVPIAKPGPAHQLRDLSRWPEEPPAPAQPLDLALFSRAFAETCGTSEAKLARQLRTPVLTLMQAAQEAQVDPFLLAALVADRSGCVGRFHEHGQIGLLGIQPAMYLRARDTPLPLSRKALMPDALRAPHHNLRVGAALLAMWQAQHEESDRAFPGAAHRTGLAHFFWGDRVVGSGDEDRVLTIRRRLLSSYLKPPVQTHLDGRLGLQLVSPLDGVPRVATSGLGEPRADGRWHRGVDITGVVGEPVRAIADGVVIFAGVNLPGKSRTGPISPQKISRYRRRALGAGGIYLCIQHEAPTAVVSCYMHLDSYLVHVGQSVRAGEQIAALGETGVQASLPHLHLEIRHGDQIANAAKVLDPYLIPPQATLTNHLLKRRLREGRMALHRAGRVSSR